MTDDCLEWWKMDRCLGKNFTLPLRHWFVWEWKFLSTRPASSISSTPDNLAYLCTRNLTMSSEWDYSVDEDICLAYTTRVTSHRLIHPCTTIWYYNTKLRSRHVISVVDKIIPRRKTKGERGMRCFRRRKASSLTYDIHLFSQTSSGGEEKCVETTFLHGHFLSYHTTPQTDFLPTWKRWLQSVQSRKMEKIRIDRLATQLKKEINKKLPKGNIFIVPPLQSDWQWFLNTGWHGRVVKLNPKNATRCRLQVQLYTPHKDCIRSRSGLKKYCAKHNLNLVDFNVDKFFHNSSGLLANDNGKPFTNTQPTQLKMGGIYTNALENSTKTFATVERKRGYPRFSNLGAIDPNCQTGRKYLSPQQPGSAITQTTFCRHVPIVCEKIKSDTLRKKNEAVIPFFPRTGGLDTVYGFIEHRLTGRYEVKPCVVITKDSRFRGATPFENFRYHV